MADITLQSISHSYVAKPGDDDYALRDVDLAWRHGGAYALLGPSGCGKTTLLNIMSGLIRPSSGRVRYGDTDVTDLSTRQRNIAQVFQFPVVYDTMSVFDNLAFPLRNRGVAEAELRKRVAHLAELLDLTPVLDRKATGLTADMKQIISLGRGLVRDDVAAILFDEPLTVIDPHKKWVLRRKLREIHRQFQHTLIYVTHDQTEALTFADQVVVMHQGRVLQQGTPEQLFTDPAHTFVGYFIGSPGMSFLPCRIEGAAAMVAGHPVPLPADLAARARLRTGTLKLGIRPELITVQPATADSTRPAGLPVRVTFVEDHGRFRIVSGVAGAGAAEHPIKIKLDAAGSAGQVELRPGDTCRAVIPPERLRLYEDDHLIA
jgi:glycerol transport system ATP-binding protein